MTQPNDMIEMKYFHILLSELETRQLNRIVPARFEQDLTDLVAPVIEPEFALLQMRIKSPATYATKLSRRLWA